MAGEPFLVMETEKATYTSRLTEPLEDRNSQRPEITPSLIDLLLVLARNRRKIGATIGLFFLIGTILAIVAPNEYSARAVVIREIQSRRRDVGLGFTERGHV